MLVKLASYGYMTLFLSTGDRPQATVRLPILRWTTSQTLSPSSPAVGYAAQATDPSNCTLENFAEYDPTHCSLFGNASDCTMLGYLDAAQSIPSYFCDPDGPEARPTQVFFVQKLEPCRSVPSNRRHVCRNICMYDFPTQNLCRASRVLQFQQGPAIWLQGCIDDWHRATTR
jgi:hypothetical protein